MLIVTGNKPLMEGRMKINKKFALLSIFGVLLLGLIALPIARAQNNQGSGSGLLLSPTRTEIGGQPGEKKTFSITVKNVTNGNVVAKAVVNDFESDGVSGSPKLIVDETREKTPYSIKSMVSGVEDIPLKAGETKEANFSIDIPANVSPGAYFGAIRYSAIPEDQAKAGNDQVSLTASVAHLVFVEVPGDVVQSIKIEALEVQSKDGKKASIFKLPITASVKITNLGNGFSRPFGKLTITKGSKTILSDEINNVDPKGIVLPNSSRTFSNDVKGVSAPGKYTVSAGVAYGNGGEVVTYENTFWYLPLWFVAVLILILIVLIVGGSMVYKKVSNKSFRKSGK